MRKKPTASKTPWIVAYDGTKGKDAYAIECRRCREKQQFVSSTSLGVWLAACKVFRDQHAKCKPRKKVPK